jgi:hypothetical protein
MLRDLVDELTGLYDGFHEVFIDDRPVKMELNVMVYCGRPGEADVPVIDLDFRITHEATITFWQGLTPCGHSLFCPARKVIPEVFCPRAEGEGNILHRIILCVMSLWAATADLDLPPCMENPTASAFVCPKS